MVNKARPSASESPEARLHHAHIFASDLDATIDFYSRYLGAEVVADETLAGSRNVMVRIGDGRLNIYDQAPSRPARGGGVHHLGIQVRDLEAVVAAMTADGHEFRKPISSGEGFRWVMVGAPDEVLLELFEAIPDGMPAAAESWFAWPDD